MSKRRSTGEHEREGADEALAVLPRRRPRDDAEMDITPMIDITFLLLIFFLVASRLDTEAGVELPPARYGAPVAAKNAVIITVAPGKSGAALIYKGDGLDAKNLISASDLLAQEEEITRYVQQSLHGESPKQHALIKAERGVKHREVARVAKAVGNAADALQLYVAVLDVP